MTAPVLELTSLDVELGHGARARRILRDVNLLVNPGEIVGVIGETGSGKTTMARAILGLAPAAQGRVSVAGQDITTFGRREKREFRRQGHVQLVFQDPLLSMDPDLTVADSIAEGLRLATGRAATSRSDIGRRVDEAMQMVGLEPEFRDRRPGEISGGQRQRAAIARALAVKPQLLVCDEPVSALDASNRNKVLRLLGDLRDRLGVAIIVIAHDLGSLAGIADRVVVLYQGEIVEEGPIAEVFGRPAHPYSGLLLASAPTTGERPMDAAQLRVTRDASAFADGCVFAPRCAFAASSCATRPELVAVQGGRRVACWHHTTWRAEAQSAATRPPATIAT